MNLVLRPVSSSPHLLLPGASCVCVWRGVVVSVGFLSVFLTYVKGGRKERNRTFFCPHHCEAAQTPWVETQARTVGLLSSLPVEDSRGVKCWLSLSYSPFMGVLGTPPTRSQTPQSVSSLSPSGGWLQLCQRLTTLPRPSIPGSLQPPAAETV